MRKPDADGPELAFLLVFRFPTIHGSRKWKKVREPHQPAVFVVSTRDRQSFRQPEPQLLDIGSSSRSHTDEPFHAPAPASRRSTDPDYVVGFHGIFFFFFFFRFVVDK
jgi:hypothetical protein